MACLGSVAGIAVRADRDARPCGVDVHTDAGVVTRRFADDVGTQLRPRGARALVDARGPVGRLARANHHARAIGGQCNCPGESDVAVGDVTADLRDGQSRRGDRERDSLRSNRDAGAGAGHRQR